MTSKSNPRNVIMLTRFQSAAARAPAPPEAALTGQGHAPLPHPKQLESCSPVAEVISYSPIYPKKSCKNCRNPCKISHTDTARTSQGWFFYLVILGWAVVLAACLVRFARS